MLFRVTHSGTTLPCLACRSLPSGSLRVLADSLCDCSPAARQVDLEACKRHDLRVMRVPAYSPRSVAEHALALAFSLARNLHLSHQRVCRWSPCTKTAHNAPSWLALCI